MQKKKARKTKAKTLKAKPLTEPIYNRQEMESDPAWQAFCVYRDLPEGERSLTVVARKLNKSRAICGRWSVVWSWQKRLAALDNDKFAEQFEEFKAQHSKAIEANLTLLKGFKSEIASYIKWFKDKKKTMFEDMNPKDVVVITDIIMKLERQMYNDQLVKEQAKVADANEKETIIFEF